MTDGYNDSRIGFYSPLLKEVSSLPGAQLKDRKLIVPGSFEFKIRFMDETNYIFKSSIGQELGNFDRYVSGVIQIDSSDPIESSFIPKEYTFPDLIRDSDLLEMYTPSGVFTGLNTTTAVALNYDLRAFEESGTLGKPGFFADPTNGFYYSEESDEEAFATAPFRFYFQELAAEPNIVEFDETTNLGAIKTFNGDLLYKNIAKEIPLLPPLSIGQFEHAALGLDYSHLAYTYHDLASRDVFDGVSPGSSLRRSMAPVFNRAVGNSMAHPSIAANRVWDGNYAVDRSYVLNDLLFDSYFLSGAADQGGAFTDSTKIASKVLEDLVDGVTGYPNSNYRFVVPDSIDSSDVKDLLLTEEVSEVNGAFSFLAAFAVIEGAFNVNSTSTDAWSAMLSSLRDRAVLYQDTTFGGRGIKEDSNPDKTPVLAQAMPISPSLGSMGSDPNALYDASWTAYRSLTDEQILDLAESIVSEIKARGPFLSLGQFINREVSDRTEFNQMGAVQSALRKAGVNSKSENASLEATLLKRFDSNKMDTVAVEAASFENPEALLNEDVNEGLAGYVTQAALLKPIAPVMNARSDTFIIRSYGDVKTNGKGIVRVWCEAVVQRRVDYVEGSSVSLKPWDSTTSNSIESLFGRNFKVLSFRWLDMDEV
jgi:hypothetical protein